MGCSWRHYWLLVSAMLFSTNALAQSHDSLEKLLADFDRYFVRQMKSQKIPGAAYAVVHGDQILKVRPYGVRRQRSKARVNAHTSFRLASISKTFAAGLAAKQQQQGAFSWQDPVMLYVPELRFKALGHNQYLQVQHLLSHTTGLVPNAYDNLIEANQKLDKVLPQFVRLQPLCQPGQCYGYQNVLYSLIEQVLEQSTGTSYEQLMQEQLFGPLQMADASLGRQAFIENPNHATGHLKLKRGWYPKQPSQAYYNFPAAAGVNASISDMAHWLLAQLGNAPNVLSYEVLTTLTTPHVETKRDLRRKQWRYYLNKAEYGLGWRLYEFKDEPLVYHGGWVAGFRADIAYSPARQLGIVVLLNAESHAINLVTTRFWKMVMAQSQFAQLQQRGKPNASSSAVPAALMLRHNQLQPYRSADF